MTMDSEQLADKYSILYREQLIANNKSVETTAELKALFGFAMDALNAAIARAEAAEAQLAAQAWRPVTEKPEDSTDIEVIVTGAYHADDEEWSLWAGAYFLGLLPDDEIAFKYWRPLPTND